MVFSNFLIRTIFASRLRAIDRFRRDPLAVQREQLRRVVDGGQGGGYFEAHHPGGKILDYEGFRALLPVVTYEDLQPYAERILGGEQSVLTHDRVRWMAKSSGTTGARSKFIPITKASLEDCHYRGGRDVLAVFADNFPNSKAFTGKSLTLGGTHSMVNEGGLLAGDLSAILIDNTPWWVSSVRLPGKDVALESDFERKVEMICKSCSSERVTSFAGVPSWNLVLMKRVLEHNNARTLHDVWPDMSLFIHGGVAFAPYREQYREILPAAHMTYMETYNASEGFFAIQDDPSDSSMLLMLDYGTFYEFLALSDLDYPERSIPLEDVRVGVNYAMIISTIGGLYRYLIGDTVEFTSVTPYRLRITGRTKSFINAFGEELIIDNAEKALKVACDATGALVRDYTVAPVFMEAATAKGAHEWVVEFARAPADVELFAAILDREIRAVNSDYDAKRTGSVTMARLLLRNVPEGSFYRWMQSRGKVGGQNKVPRLHSTREYVEALMGG